MTSSCPSRSAHPRVAAYGLTAPTPTFRLSAWPSSCSPGALGRSDDRPGTPSMDFEPPSAPGGRPASLCRRDVEGRGRWQGSSHEVCGPCNASGWWRPLAARRSGPITRAAPTACARGLCTAAPFRPRRSCSRRPTAPRAGLDGLLRHPPHPEVSSGERSWGSSPSRVFPDRGPDIVADAGCPSWPCVRRARLPRVLGSRCGLQGFALSAPP
jgi:hypothetical protein